MKAFCLSLLLLLYFPVALHAEDFFAYLENLQKRAQQQELYKHPQWLRLLHYAPLEVQGTSEVEDPLFFMSRHGREDPAQELYETLEAIFDPVFERGDAHAICRLPARFHWLHQQLEFDPQHLPPVVCKNYEAWRRLIQVQSVSLVFASSYMGNPSSVFGHTFLKFNQKKGNPSLNLLAHVVQYQATVEDEIGFVYALKGLFGGYRGHYVLNPYYTPILTNIEYEDRSIWEYELNLTPEELEMLVRHSWELAHTYIPYFFTLENCSYRTLELIEVAAPRYPLKEAYHFWAIPATTVRDVLAQEGLVARMNYFPARTRQLLQKFNTMTANEQKILLTLIHHPEALHKENYPSPERKALLLDAALDYLRSRFNANQEDALLKKNRRHLLRARSQLGAVSVKLSPEQESPIHQGHRPNRLLVGLGGSSEESYWALGLRPAYHDLLADETGHLENSQAVVADLQIRRFNDGEWALHRLDLINIINLAPRNLLQQESSWRVQIGLEPSTKEPCRLCRKLMGQVGWGYSWEFGRWREALVYLMGNGTLEVDAAYLHDYLVGGGIVAGILWEWMPRWKTQMEFQSTHSLWGEAYQYLQGKIHQRWTLAQNQDLRVELDYRNFWEMTLAFNHYY